MNFWAQANNVVRLTKLLDRVRAQDGLGAAMLNKSIQTKYPGKHLTSRLGIKAAKHIGDLPAGTGKADASYLPVLDTYTPISFISTISTIIKNMIAYINVSLEEKVS